MMHSYHDAKVDAHTRLGKTKVFQDLVEEVYTQVLSCYQEEEFWDTLRGLKRQCTDPDILGSHAEPHVLRKGKPGVPVCVLPFVMIYQEQPVPGSKYAELRTKSLNLLGEFDELMTEVKDEGYSARIKEDVSDKQKLLFAEEAMEFVKEYTRCTVDDVDAAKAKLNKDIPGLYTRFEDPQATDEERMEFLDAKATYYALFGYPLSVVELARLRGPAIVRGDA